MKILALEFSSPQRSVALLQQTDTTVGWMEHEATETGTRTGRPFELIEEVLRQAGVEREQVDRVVVGLGPGSYNGIRAAIALAQGWQLGRGVAVAGASSAECIAARAQAQGVLGRVAAVIDAQRGEFYCARFELSAAGWQPLDALSLVSHTTVSECEQGGDLLIGPEVQRWFPQGQTIYPSAAVLAKLASARTAAVSGEKLEPIYLRTTTFVKALPPRILPEAP